MVGNGDTAIDLFDKGAAFIQFCTQLLQAVTQACQWRAQVMCNIVLDMPDAFHQPRDLIEHGIEAASELIKVVRGSRCLEKGSDPFSVAKPPALAGGAFTFAILSYHRKSRLFLCINRHPFFLVFVLSPSGVAGNMWFADEPSGYPGNYFAAI